jgi:hypothetical protein
MESLRLRQPELPELSVWDRLASQGNYALLEKLHYVELEIPGFSTVVVPAKGFSDDPETHNAVLAWLREHHVNIHNPSLMIARLERTCEWRRRIKWDTV